MVIGWGESQSIRGWGLQRLPAWSWIRESCPTSELAQPSETGADGESSLTTAGMGSHFPGAWMPQSQGENPCPQNSASSSSTPHPELCGQASLPSLYDRLHHVLEDVGTDNGLQWVPWHSWGFCFLWVALTVVPEAGERERSQAKFLFSLHWDFI